MWGNNGDSQRFSLGGNDGGNKWLLKFAFELACTKLVPQQTAFHSRTRTLA